MAALIIQHNGGTKRTVNHWPYFNLKWHKSNRNRWHHATVMTGTIRSVISTKCSLYNLIGGAMIIVYLANLFITSFDTNDYYAFLPTEKNFWLTIIITTLLAPFLETLVCQTLVIRLMLYKKTGWVIACLTSALIFGLLHFSSLYHIAVDFIAGGVLALLFIVGELKAKKGTRYVFLAHTIHNFVVSIPYIHYYFMNLNPNI